MNLIQKLPLVRFNIFDANKTISRYNLFSFRLLFYQLFTSISKSFLSKKLNNFLIGN